jgi:hypothetical protein
MTRKIAGILGLLFGAGACAASASADPSSMPVLEAQVFRASTIAIERDAKSKPTGRFERVAGKGTVLLLAASRKGPPLTRDRDVFWNVAIAFPGDVPAAITLPAPGVTVVAQVAAEDVLYFSTSARGRLSTRVEGGRIAGDVDLEFTDPVKALARPAELPVKGAFAAEVPR